MKFKSYERIKTSSIKHNPDLIKKWTKTDVKEIFQSFWVADMDIEVAQPIKDVLLNDVAFGVYGYSDFDFKYYHVVKEWFFERYQVIIEKDWICFSNGIVPAINYLLDSFNNTSCNVLIQTPVYYPFYTSITNNGMKIVENKLIYEDYTYSIDFSDLELKLSDDKTNIMLLCNPHNPIGRVLRYTEIEEIVRLCKEYNVLLISDEIHADIIHNGNIFTSALRFIDKYDKIIVCSSPSKTFNLAGLQNSNIIIKNNYLRETYLNKTNSISLLLPNIFSINASIAAYSQCDEWLDNLLNHLNRNIIIIDNFLSSNLPLVKLVPLEATYLAWLDFSNLAIDFKCRAKLLEENGIVLDHGSLFGDDSSQFERINIACDSEYLIVGLQLIKEALSN